MIQDRLAAISSFTGVDIVETAAAVTVREDWSMVRSPARARRRLKRGYPQNIVRINEPTSYMMGRTLYAHPVVVQRLRNELRRQGL